MMEEIITYLKGAEPINVKLYFVERNKNQRTKEIRGLFDVDGFEISDTIIEKFKIIDADSIGNIAEQAKKIEEELKNTEETKLIEIKKAKGKAEVIIKEAYETAEKRSQESIEKTEIKAQEILDKTKKEIISEKERSVEEAKKEIADVSILIAEKLISSNIDKDQQKRLVDDVLSKMK